MIKITKKLITRNFSKRTNFNIKYIVIHDTANTNTGANAQAHYNYFNNNDLDKSAHYFVDDKEILQIIEDKNRAWHCGDGKGQNKITNENSIGIEICINKDGDYNKAKENTILLSAYLLDKYNLNINDLVRHFDASGKICPNTMTSNNWEDWDEFKKEVEKNLKVNKIILTREKIESYVKGTYKTFLERDPEEEGFNYWTSEINNLNTLQNFVNTVLTSEEFKELNTGDQQGNDKKRI